MALGRGAGLLGVPAHRSGPRGFRAVVEVLLHFNAAVGTDGTLVKVEPVVRVFPLVPDELICGNGGGGA